MEKMEVEIKSEMEIETDEGTVEKGPSAVHKDHLVNKPSQISKLWYSGISGWKWSQA